jgi:hypothetical protein
MPDERQTDTVPVVCSRLYSVEQGKEGRKKVTYSNEEAEQTDTREGKNMLEHLQRLPSG